MTLTHISDKMMRKLRYMKMMMKNSVLKMITEKLSTEEKPAHHLL
jgi:hypothetical protein